MYVNMLARGGQVKFAEHSKFHIIYECLILVDMSFHKSYTLKEMLFNVTVKFLSVFEQFFKNFNI